MKESPPTIGTKVRRVHDDRVGVVTAIVWSSRISDRSKHYDLGVKWTQGAQWSLVNGWTDGASDVAR